MKNILNKSVRSISRQSGLSLVELMISITLGLVIMAGVLQLYVSASRNASNSQGLSRIQENIRYAVTRLGNVIARAGNMGCFSFAAVGAPTPADNDVQADGIFHINKSIENYLTNRYQVIVNPNASTSTIVIDQDNNIVPAGGDDTAWFDFENSFISGENNNAVANDDVLDTTDTLIVKFLDNSSTVAITSIPDNNSFTLSSTDDLSEGGVAFAGDCNKLYVFNVSDVDDGDNTVSMNNGFLHNLKADSLSRFYTGESGAYRYYIGGVNCSSVGNSRGNCSLFRSLNGGAAQELVRGVHDFQVLYGYEGNNQNDVQTNGRLTVDRVQITMSFNAMDSGTLLNKTITHVFAVRNQL